jgi:hypothetical protein
MPVAMGGMHPGLTHRKLLNSSPEYSGPSKTFYVVLLPYGKIPKNILDTLVTIPDTSRRFQKFLNIL